LHGVSNHVAAEPDVNKLCLVMWFCMICAADFLAFQFLCNWPVTLEITPC